MSEVRHHGRVAIVALNRERKEPARWEGRWPAIVICVDGDLKDQVDDRGLHLDDWPDGFADKLPGPGIWIWEGDFVWRGGMTDCGEEWDCHGEGAFRRPNAGETFRLMRGDVAWNGARGPS